MKRFLKKLFKKKPVYEPAGVIHYGQAHITVGDTLYQIYNQPDGTAEVWAWEQHLGTYTEDAALLAIIDHAKGQKRP